jgi:hypothetical protein
MNKSYMNREERSHFIFLIALIAKCNEIIEVMTKHNRSKTLLKFLRTGVTWIQKGLIEWGNSVDERTKDQLMRESERYTAALIFDKDALAHTRKIAEQDKAMRAQIAKEDPDIIYNMAELVLSTTCRKCDGKHRDTCWVFETFYRLSIPEWDDKQYCRYSGAGNVDKP